ncbi:MAG: DUF368 domain-containing protein [Eubacteriales bacterium]|jgi:putative membrane protein|nr:DUF368 domain-containing protein [Eubacteriales bacterium]
MNDTTERRSHGGFFYRMLCGFFLGVSVIAPGVSASIMAVMMGIYDRLVDIIANPFKNFKRNVIYMLPMGMGALLSVLVLVGLLGYMFDNFPVPSYMLFIGLIGGSLPDVFKEANTDGFRRRYVVAVVSALAFALAMGLASEFEFVTAASGIVSFSVCGFLAGMSAMVPGMSVSMVLMMLGVYEPLLEAARRFDLSVAVPVGLGFVAGMILISNFVRFIFRRHHNFAYFMVFGFMCGSLITIFPGLPQGAVEWILSVAALAAGIGVSFLFHILGERLKNDKLTADM